jgi:hypothetical protein
MLEGTLRSNCNLNRTIYMHAQQRLEANVSQKEVENAGTVVQKEEKR